MRILYHILYPQGMGDDRMIYDGYRYAFQNLGHEVIPFSQNNSLAQTLEEIRPNIFMTSLNLIDFSLIVPILKKFRQGGGRVVLRAGYLTDSFQHKAVVSLIKEDLLADLYWAEIEVPHFYNLTGKQIHLIALAASREFHFPVAPVKKYACDIVFLGANLPKKRLLFKKRLWPLFKKYQVRVFGADWDWFDRYILHPLNRGARWLSLDGVVSRWRFQRQVPMGEENQLYSSAKICLNFHEQQEGGLVLLNSRTFKIPACGGFELCDEVPLLRHYFAEDELVTAINDDDFFKKIDFYLNEKEKRLTIQKKGTARAIREHTYHNRVEQLLKILEETF